MSQSKNTKSKKIVAVFFGGRSPEHDVSVISALQVMQAIDASMYEVLPVYITPDGRWVTGDILRERSNYLLDKNGWKQVQEVTLDVALADGTRRKGALLPKRGGLFGGGKPIEFDVALPVFHGLFGEDGNVQGLFELAGVPFAGPRAKDAAVFMDKVTTKQVMSTLGIPNLPYAVLQRPDEGYMIAASVIEDALKTGGVRYPCIIKPVHLGSSIGVAKCQNVEEIAACLPTIFESDDCAIVEPAVQNLVEYNVAVCRVEGETRTSAIERPKATEELLDFKRKYLSGGDNKGGTKSGTKAPGQSSEGMLSLTRELNPKLEVAMEENIRTWSARLFDGIGASGAPRIDYLCDSKTGEIWMNEVNPIPGSYGYFLWEAADKSLLFSEFLSLLIDEACRERRKKTLPKDPVPVDARLLKRPV